VIIRDGEMHRREELLNHVFGLSWRSHLALRIPEQNRCVVE